MSAWDLYNSRLAVRGSTKRQSTYIHEVDMLNSKLGDSLSYHTVQVDGVSQDVAIINSDNLNEKFMLSMPEEDITCGGIVSFASNYWLITEKDANNEVYTRTKLVQCNHLLKWVDDNDVIHEQWCVVEDGTKYLTGEFEDRNFVTTRGDSRIAITLGRNADTLKLCRKNRFIIDDPDRLEKLAYTLSKPLMTGKVYNGNGIFSFVLQECASTDDDNMELGIADYYKHFPKDADDDTSAGVNSDTTADTSGGTSSSGRRSWL